MSIKLDSVVEANRELLHKRSQLGIAKYGTTLEDAKLDERQLVVHALEEALDLANYLQAQLQRIDGV
jgi:predicted metalloenzyme YecM